MATAGPRYPGTVATEAGPSGDNDWLTASNVGADDDSEAQITAATYDAADHSYRLKATNFGFDADIPAGSTINGITVEIAQRRFAGAAQDQEVRLYDSTATLVGDDKQTATAWPATETIATYGGAADMWTSGLDDADIRSAGFGVAHIVLADAANTDIGVDFIRVTVDYTAPPVVLIPGTASLTLTLFAPTVLTPRLVIPGVVALVTARFTPVVTVTSNVLVIPGVVALVTTRFAPTVLATNHILVVPGLATLVATGFAPTVLTPRLVTPGLATLVTTLFAPTVVVSGGLIIVPGTASLVLTRFAPTVLTPRLVTPGVASLVTVRFAPTVLIAAVIDIGIVIPSEVSWFSATASEGSHGVFPSESE